MFNLQNEVNGWLREYFNGVDISKKLKKVGGYWISNLMKPHSRASRGKFMFDLDKEGTDSENIIDIISRHANILFEVKTKNGWHIVTEPFDTKKIYQDKEYASFREVVELKKDALLFVEYVKKVD